jgi:hypothetical protein
MLIALTKTARQHRILMVMMAEMDALVQSMTHLWCGGRSTLRRTRPSMSARRAVLRLSLHHLCEPQVVAARGRSLLLRAHTSHAQWRLMSCRQALWLHRLQLVLLLLLLLLQLLLLPLLLQLVLPLLVLLLQPLLLPLLLQLVLLLLLLLLQPLLLPLHRSRR